MIKWVIFLAENQAGVFQVNFFLILCGLLAIVSSLVTFLLNLEKKIQNFEKIKLFQNCNPSQARRACSRAGLQKSKHDLLVRSAIVVFESISKFKGAFFKFFTVSRKIFESILSSKNDRAISWPFALLWVRLIET